MGSKIDKALDALAAMERGAVAECPRCIASTRADMLLTLVYLALLLSVPLQDVSRLVWFAAYPIVAASVAGCGYGRVLRQSLYVLPLIVFVGIFNPLVDRTPAFVAWGVTVSRGWVSFVSITVRGLLSVQAVLVLTASCGFADVCRQLRALGVPSFLTTQLLMVYRYMSVLLEELQTMARARAARGYGQLFLRSVDRAERIHRAMLARGFDGTMPRYTAADRHGAHGWEPVAWTVAWIAAMVWMRFGRLITFNLQ